MANDRVQQALSRIENAIDRIEARIARGGGDTDPALAERHERLRAQTAAALARLDRLLGSGTGD
jgi:predicted ABC-type ATPase